MAKENGMKSASAFYDLIWFDLWDFFMMQVFFVFYKKMCDKNENDFITEW